MGSLLIITGPPGAGKSSVAHTCAAEFDPSVLVQGDAFFSFLARGAIPPWLPESDDQNRIVTDAAGSAAGRYAAGGYTTIYDGVVGPWFLPRFVAATGLDSLDYVVLMPPVERCVGRVRARQGHDFTDEDAARQMHHEFAHATIDPRHVLLDPPDQPEDVAELVIASRRADALRYRIPV